MGTVATLHDASGVRHDSRISSSDSPTDANPSGPGPAGDLLWARTVGGAGGALHAGYRRIATKPTLSWLQPNDAGPWRAPIRRGEALPPERLVDAPSTATRG